MLKQCFVLIICFILATIVGTISHEFGHIAVAEFYGHNTKLHYGSMNYSNSEKDSLIEILLALNTKRIQEKNSNPNDSVEYRKLAKQIFKLTPSKEQQLWISIGGPLQTILVGSFGFIVLIIRRKKIHINGLKKIDHLLIFLSLFWLRQVANPLLAIAEGVYANGYPQWGNRSDEVKIAKYLDLSVDGMMYSNLLFSSCICAIVFFVIIPRNWRLKYILSGIIGSLLGAYIWFDLLGPKLLP